MKLTLVTPVNWKHKPHPRSARLIQKDGTTVGYLHDTELKRDGCVVIEHVRAVGDDPDIQKILENWYSEYAAERKAEARQSAFRRELEIKRQRERERTEARRALKL